MNKKMPAVFIGHGNPMNALIQNEFSRSWKKLSQTLPRPKAVLAISAHWYTSQTAVTAVVRPKTIHDFGGFPKELYEFEYPAPGDEELAQRVQKLLSPTSVLLDTHWGLDHGSWSVLCHMYPQADVPVVQLSLNATLSLQQHYALGNKLALLREEGVLILGSGNIVHNLSAYAWRDPVVKPYEWAVQFEKKVRALINNHHHQAAIDYLSLGPEAIMSVPTPDHYLPMLYVLSTQKEGESVTFPVEGIEGGSISMLALQVGSNVSEVSEKSNQ